MIDFIKSEEFKSFWYKLNQNELSLHVKHGDTDEKVIEMVQKLQAYDPNSESLTIEEARELVQRSGMIVFPRWDISSSFLLDQIRRQQKSMAIWSIALESKKPTLMEIKETLAGNVIFQNAHSTFSDQIYNLQKTATMLGKNKIDILEEQLVQTYEKYLDARKKYEEEMRRTYVSQHALEEPKKENEDLKREERSLQIKVGTRLVYLN